MWALVILGAGLTGYFYEKGDCLAAYRTVLLYDAKALCVYVQGPLAQEFWVSSPGQPAGAGK